MISTSTRSRSGSTRPGELTPNDAEIAPQRTFARRRGLRHRIRKWRALPELFGAPRDAIDLGSVDVRRKHRVERSHVLDHAQ